MQLVLEILVASWAMLGEMSPYLLLGFLIAGVIMLALASVQFVSPDLLSGWGPISYARLRPAA